ncbi:MAG: M3 family oligoendopeptidase [Defluviitaleaceae bacterium]|nr:M3 family oligoendopeptidase [Defluviitaleaceae bacterium]
MAEKWCLKAIYTGFDSPEFKADFLEIPKTVDKMNTHRIESFEDAAAIIKILEDYAAKNDRLSSFAHYVYATETSNADATKFIYLLEAIDAETSRMKVRMAKFLAETAERGFDIAALAKEYGIGDYAYQLCHMAEEFCHMMSEDEETLSAQMSNMGASAWGLLQDKLISMLTCEYADPKSGKVQTIGINECRNLAYDADADVRKSAYEAELASYPKIEESCAAAMNSIKGEVNLLSGLRKYKHPLERTLFDSNMSQKTLDAMFEAIDANVQIFRDYLKAKARYLGKSALPFYDLFAPVGASCDKKYSYDEAKKFISENFAKFSPGMESTARQAFENSWIDVYPHEGKVSGAFCGDVYAIKQFRILLNFGGNLSDIITLAHELGHGYHSMQVMQEGILNTHYPMPLAETASTFCEMIVTNAALKTLEGDAKLQLLENSLQDATQVILDIYSRYLFEKSVFEARSDHPLSVNELNNLMLTAQRTAYGDGLDPKLLHPYMWAIKPHYYSASFSFYNFPYAFGHLLANGLYKIYDEDADAFGKKYDDFLRVSGKMPIKNSCETLGINVDDTAFWASALDVIKDTIKEFEELTA